MDVAEGREDGELFGPDCRESGVLIRVRPDELLDGAKVTFASDKEMLFYSQEPTEGVVSDVLDVHLQPLLLVHRE